MPRADRGSLAVATDHDGGVVLSDTAAAVSHKLTEEEARWLMLVALPAVLPPRTVVRDGR